MADETPVKAEIAITLGERTVYWVVEPDVVVGLLQALVQTLGPATGDKEQ